MTDPNRLLHEGSDLGKALLSAADDEAMPPELRRKIHAGLLASVTVGAAGATLGTASTASASTASAATKTSSFLASLTFTKAVGIVAIGAVASVGARAVTQSRSVPRASTKTVATAMPTNPTQTWSSARGLPPLESPAAPTPASALPPTAAAVPTPASPPVIAVARAAPLAEESAVRVAPAAPRSLAEELAALESARAAFDAGDLDTAIERLNRHDVDYPDGALRPEALVIRIQAYAKKRDVARVRQLAQLFRVQYPGHPFAAHLDGIVAGLGE